MKGPEKIYSSKVMMGHEKLIESKSCEKPAFYEKIFLAFICGLSREVAVFKPFPRKAHLPVKVTFLKLDFSCSFPVLHVLAHKSSPAAHFDYFLGLIRQ